MRKLLAFVLCLVWIAGAAAQDSALPGAADRAAIRAAIEGQIAAFRADDGIRAFGYAAPGIQARFGTPENFMRMVRSAYAPVYRPSEVEFRDLAVEGGRTIQRVLLVGADRVPVIALYMMEKEPDGSWKIAGCVLTKSEQETA